MSKKGYSSHHCVIIYITMKTNKYINKRKTKGLCPPLKIEKKNTTVYNSTITQLRYE